MLNRFAKLAAVAAIGTLSLAACGGSSSDNSPSATTGATEATSAATDATSAATESATESASATDTASEGGVDITCPGGTINGGGSSAQDLAMQTLTKEYNAACGSGTSVIYTKTGSGAGIKDFYNKKLQWAGSDSALKDKPNADKVIETEKVKERCGGNPGWNLPMIVGPVAFAYNLDGVDKLVLTPTIISDIYMGKITMWNDKAIAAVNKDAKLPAEKIVPYYRGDESGTSENVSKYLKASAPKDFTAEPAKKFPATAGVKKEGTQAVADGVKATKGAFGYMEWKYAKDAQLGVAALDNGDGVVELTSETAGKAMAVAEVTGQGNDLSMKMKYTGLGAGAYPMVMVTYEVVCSTGLDAKQGAVLKDFLTYVSSTDSQSKLEAQGYAPLPAEVQTKVAKAVSELK